MLAQLSKKSGSEKRFSEEQITNKLNELGELTKKILEKESVREIVYTSSKEKSETPIVEELDEDTFIPDIDISDMKLKGNLTESIGELDDIESAVDMLSRLKE